MSDRRWPGEIRSGARRRAVALTARPSLRAWSSALATKPRPTVLIIGDSLVDSQLYTTDKENIWASRVAGLIRERLGMPTPSKPFETARAGLGPYNSPQNIYWTYSAGSFNLGFGLGGVTRNMSANQTATLNVALPAGVTSMDVYYSGNASPSGVMGVRVASTLIDSWATTTVGAGGGVLNARRRRVTLAEPTAGGESLVIRHESGNAVFFDALYLYMGNEDRDVVVLHSGRGGSWAANTGTPAQGWSTMDSGEMLGELVAHAAPDLVLLSAGTNDWINATAAATVETRVQACITQLRAAAPSLPVCLVMINEPSNIGSAVFPWTQMRDIWVRLAALNRCTLFSLNDAIGSFVGGANPNDSGDGLHSNEAGQLLIGDALADLLMPPLL